MQITGKGPAPLVLRFYDALTVFLRATNVPMGKPTSQGNANTDATIEERPIL
jgi:hypothetical protein